MSAFIAIVVLIAIIGLYILYKSDTAVGATLQSIRYASIYASIIIVLITGGVGGIAIMVNAVINGNLFLAITGFTVTCIFGLIAFFLRIEAKKNR